MMAEMFLTASHPFYQSASVVGLSPIDEQAYYDFASRHLLTVGKTIDREAFGHIYNRFDGITWYVQYVMNILYTTDTEGNRITLGDAGMAIESIMHQQTLAYKSLLFQLSPKQKQLLLAISMGEKTRQVMSQKFLSKYNLSASSVQNALKVLLDRDFITQDEDGYEVYDKFFGIWLRKVFS